MYFSNMRLENEFLLFCLSVLCFALLQFAGLESAIFASPILLIDMILNLDISICHFPFGILFIHAAIF